jgi:pimeloyl-ACP methyl ester carboxylesterase
VGTLAAAGAVTPILHRTAGAAQSASKVRNVVLVHGLFADGSCWAEVIARLQAAGINATAVQNPLTTLESSVAATQRALALQDGPTVLVGHSFSGMIVTEAGVDPKVTSLVYVAARAPDAGEDHTALASRFPTPPASAASSGPAIADSSVRRLSCAISPATCRRRRRAYFMQFSVRSNVRYLPVRQRMQPGARSRAGTLCPQKIGRSILISNGSWRNGWERRQLR